MKPGDRVEVYRVWDDVRSRRGTVTRVQDHGWGDKYSTVWVRLDDGTAFVGAMPCAPEIVRLVDGENA